VRDLGTRRRAFAGRWRSDERGRRAAV